MRETSLIAVAFLVAGVVAAVLWYLIWSPAPETDVYLRDGGRPFFEHDVIFRATGIYALVALLVGIVVGATLMVIFDRDEVLTLAVVVVASLIAGLLMALLGHLFGPDPPATIDIEGDYPDGFPVTQADLSAHPLAVVTAMPGGALLGCVAILLCLRGRHDPRRQETDPLSVRPEPAELG